MSYSADATPDERLDELVEKLEEAFEEAQPKIQRDRGELTLVVAREQLLGSLESATSEPKLAESNLTGDTHALERAR